MAKLNVNPVKFNIHKNLKNLDGHIANFKDPPLKSIGGIGKADIRKNFDTSGANIGKKWDGVKRGGKPLMDSRQMYKSIGFRSVKARKVVLFYQTRTGAGGFNIAQLHDQGGRHVPRRQSMKLSRNARRDITELQRGN